MKFLILIMSLVSLNSYAQNSCSEIPELTLRLNQLRSQCAQGPGGGDRDRGHGRRGHGDNLCTSSAGASTSAEDAIKLCSDRNYYNADKRKCEETIQCSGRESICKTISGAALSAAAAIQLCRDRNYYNTDKAKCELSISCTGRTKLCTSISGAATSAEEIIKLCRDKNYYNADKIACEQSIKCD